ncbi:MAG: hypothetical protein R2685_06175 [Candidatus Nitrosocosmicus sp.]|nr:hypothetical protein [Candidatus Nitrosocosmicus sp.]
MYFYFRDINIALVTLVSALSVALLVSYAPINIAIGQSNDTQTQNGLNETVDYTGFHSNIEQINGHIDKAVDNKIANNQKLTLAHTEHPIAEVLSLITIPLNESNSELNQTYYENLFNLDNLAKQNSTIADYENQSIKSLDLSDNVISTVIPSNILLSSEHNASVVKDLLNTAGSEYAEGVADGKLVQIVEFQDGSSFINRAYLLFNDTQNISNDANKITLLQTDFANLTDSVNNLKDPSVIDQMIVKINSELGGENNQANGTSTQSDEQLTSGDYIAKIRGLLDQVISSYETNDKVKAKELATTAYLDNFEFIEAPIGKELSDKGESLLREKLRDQIDSNATLYEIKQNIADINAVLDDAAIALSNSTAQ